MHMHVDAHTCIDTDVCGSIFKKLVLVSSSFLLQLLQLKYHTRSRIRVLALGRAHTHKHTQTHTSTQWGFQQNVI